MTPLSDEPRRFDVVEIGVTSSPLKNRREAPQQPGPAGRSHVEGTQAGARAVIHIHEPYRACLADLAGFERVWLLYIFDRNHGWRAEVKPPRGGPRRGVFATRAPHRPSRIGMTAARLLAVADDHIDVDETDLLDGTPVIDIKPYLPFADAHPHAAMGWLDALHD